MERQAAWLSANVCLPVPPSSSSLSLSAQHLPNNSRHLQQVAMPWVRSAKKPNSSRNECMNPALPQSSH